jgi:type III secretion protein I
MIDALVSTGTLAAGNTATHTPTQASLGDVERFRSAMMSAQSPPASATLENPASKLAIQQAIEPAAQKTVNEKSSLGDAILGTLQDLSTDTQQRYGKVGEVLSKPDISMSELMSLQYTLLQTSVQFEIASKGISKFTQNLDSILKTS